MYLKRNNNKDVIFMMLLLEIYPLMTEDNKHDIIIKEIAGKLKKLRVDKGFSSYESFAYQHDLSRVQYWRMEKGTNFTIKYLLRVLDIHQISIEEFFSKKDTELDG